MQYNTAELLSAVFFSGLLTLKGKIFILQSNG
jgi:hypothetical protein